MAATQQKANEKLRHREGDGGLKELGADVVDERGAELRQEGTGQEGYASNGTEKEQVLDARLSVGGAPLHIQSVPPQPRERQGPLSKDFSKITNLGTRHSAALGLSERCDAMCLVVSEETGTISFALRGDLVAVKDLEELQDGIEIFLTKHLPKTPQSQVYHFLTENMREKAIATCVSVLLWLFFVGFGAGR